MRKNEIYFLILICIFSCNNNQRNNNKVYLKEKPESDIAIPHLETRESKVPENTMNCDGVLWIKTDVLEKERDTVYIYDKNNNIANYIFSSETDNPHFYNEDIHIRSYYPDYYIIIMDSYNRENNKYKVLYNNEYYFIPHKNGITKYEPWKSHILNCWITTDQDNPIREDSMLNSKIISRDYTNYSFKGLEVKGDWIFVKCDLECEGCPNNEVIKGWLKWKEEDSLLVNLYYNC